MPTHHFKNSAMLHSCDKEGDHLIITFSNGSQYKYYGAAYEHEALTKADSAGKHFGANVKDKYKYEKVR